jgi:hypothetical protein
MHKYSEKKLIELGIKVADSALCDEDRIWSRYSNDKVDIGLKLAKVIRVLSKEFPLDKSFRALSIGSSAEPQFRILDTAFCGGLYLLDIDKDALCVIKERIRRQCTKHVFTIKKDYNKIFLNADSTRDFVKNKLGGEKVELITLHHSLYYSQKTNWEKIFENLYRYVLAPKGAIHAVLMSAKSKKHNTSTWVYNYFAGKFCGCHNDQDLYALKNQLNKNFSFNNSQVLIKTSHVKFCVNDFEKLMAVVWMVLLCPGIHKYTFSQKESIVKYIYKYFWQSEKPLIQDQDHLVLYRGIAFKGVI